MSLAIVYTRAKLGIDAPLVTVETHLSNGLPSLAIVGLPETAVKESKDRVRSAIINSHFEFPARRITINLAPADLPKGGGQFDLPIALGILAASDQIPRTALHHYEFLGELALSGELRPISGALPAAIQAAKANRAIFLPIQNRHEASLPEKASVLPAQHLLAVCAHLHQRELISPFQLEIPKNIAPHSLLDLQDIKGQQSAKRALEVAAAGGHNLLMMGPPGTGKTMLASRLPSILPRLTEEQALEVAAVRSISNHAWNIADWRTAPFRTPHHTSSAVALVGGGSSPKPGEITLAHRGVLFLDELPEFQNKVLEVLREPMESGQITISRAQAQIVFPSQFQLIAAMNPCPCGYHGDPKGRCHCGPALVKRYREKISGPVLDRIDIQIVVPPLPSGTLSNATCSAAESSATVRQRVNAARQKQMTRNQKPNSQMTQKEIETYCQLDAQQQQLLENAVDKLGLSARAFHRILKIARTIADLEGLDQINTAQLSEAINYRSLLRQQRVP